MDRGPGRSRGVIEARSQPAPDVEGGSWERLEALYRTSRDDVYAYVATLLRDPVAAEDVTALAFERAYRRRTTFDRRRGVERAWLFGIARNAALDELRSRRRRPLLELDEGLTGESALLATVKVTAHQVATISDAGVATTGPENLLPFRFSTAAATPTIPTSPIPLIPILFTKSSFSLTNIASIWPISIFTGTW